MSKDKNIPEVNYTDTIEWNLLDCDILVEYVEADEVRALQAYAEKVTEENEDLLTEIKMMNVLRGEVYTLRNEVEKITEENRDLEEQIGYLHGDALNLNGKLKQVTEERDGAIKALKDILNYTTPPKRDMSGGCYYIAEKATKSLKEKD